MCLTGSRPSWTERRSACGWGEYSGRPGTEARLSECSALSKDEEVVLTAMPEAVERGQLRVFTVEFKVYRDGELVYEHTSGPKEKTAQNYSAFSELQGPWETEYRPVDSGEYRLDCILHGNMTGLLIGSGPRSFKWLEWGAQSCRHGSDEFPRRSNQERERTLPVVQQHGLYVACACCRASTDASAAGLSAGDFRPRRDLSNLRLSQRGVVAHVAA